MSKENRSTETPVLQALILADDVYVDRDTGKKVIAGVFSNLWSATFPSRFHRTTKAVISLTNCLGPVRLSLDWSDLNSGEVLMQSPEIRVSPDDPVATHEFIVDVPPFPLPHPGVFEFSAYCNDQRLGGLRITVGTRQA